MLRASRARRMAMSLVGSALMAASLAAPVSGQDGATIYGNHCDGGLCHYPNGQRLLPPDRQTSLVDRVNDPAYPVYDFCQFKNTVRQGIVRNGRQAMRSFSETALSDEDLGAVFTFLSGRASQCSPQRNALAAIREFLEERRRRILQAEKAGRQLWEAIRQEQRRISNVIHHSYYRALTNSNCKAPEGLTEDGLRTVGETRELVCRAIHAIDPTVTRTTLAEALDPAQRPGDRNPSSRSGGLGTGLIGEPASTSGYVTLEQVGDEHCVVPELFERGSKVRWTCGRFQSGTVSCPDETSFIKITRSRVYLRFHCYAGDWDGFLSDLRRRGSP